MPLFFQNLYFVFIYWTFQALYCKSIAFLQRVGIIDDIFDANSTYQWNLYPQWWPNSRPGRVNGLTERWRLDPNSPGSPSRRMLPPLRLLLRSAPGEAQCPISFLLRYGELWTDWHRTSRYDADKEESLELAAEEDIIAISGYSLDWVGDTRSLQAESSAGRSWGPHGTHTPRDGYSLRSSPDAPTNGLRLNHLSGDQTKAKIILRWLHQYNQMKTWMIVCICIVFYMINDCLHILLLWIAFIIPPAFKSSNY